MSPRPLLRLFIALASCGGCGGSTSEPGASGAETGGGRDAGTRDGTSPCVLSVDCADASGGTRDAADAPRDAAGSSCPSGLPLEGTACSVTEACTFPNMDCGGADTARCLAGSWKTDRVPCGPLCPIAIPAEGTPCAPVGYVCRSWPTTSMVRKCSECTCGVDGWRCGQTCAAPVTGCTGGTACSPPGGFGCNVGGKCSPMCRCGVDSKLRCVAHTC